MYVYIDTIIHVRFYVLNYLFIKLRSFYWRYLKLLHRKQRRTNCGECTHELNSIITSSSDFKKNQLQTFLFRKNR